MEEEYKMTSTFDLEKEEYKVKLWRENKKEEKSLDSVFHIHWDLYKFIQQRYKKGIWIFAHLERE